MRLGSEFHWIEHALAAAAALVVATTLDVSVRADTQASARRAATSTATVAAAHDSAARRDPVGSDRPERAAAPRPAPAPDDQPTASARSGGSETPPASPTRATPEVSPLAQSPTQRRAVAESQQAAIFVESAALTTQADLRAARALRNGARAACLDDLLSQLHAASRGARALVASVAEASRHGDTTVLAQERVRLAILQGRASHLRSTAAACGEVGGRRAPPARAGR